jgi:hypothetical protein
MALNYNLAKVYALSDNDPEFVNEILTFVTEVPEDLAQIKGNKRKIISMPMHKIKPTLDLLGLNVAFEILQVEAWTKVEGKEKISIILSRA